MGVDGAPNHFKIGDGVTAWNDLPYDGLQGPAGTLTPDLVAARDASVAAAGTATDRATAATSAATTAVGAAGTASDKALAAATSAQTATTQATSAGTAATTATAAATTAGTAATQAGTAATTATTQASAAAGSATQAGTNATAAGASATQAAGSAATATQQASIGAAAALIFPNTAAGINASTGVAAGKYFYTPSANAAGSYDVWLNSNGTAVSAGITLPNLAAVSSIQKATSDMTRTPSRFTSLSFAVIDTTSGRVISGLDKGGAAIGASKVSTAAADLQNVTRFSSLAFAVVDASTQAVLSGISAVDGQRYEATESNVRGTAPAALPPPASLLHIGGLGQSTIIGGAGAIVTTTQPFRNVMFDSIVGPVTLTAFNPLLPAYNSNGTGSGETIFPGWTAAYNAKRSTPVPMLATVNGQGGAPISTSAKGGTHYTNLMAEVTAAITLAKARGDVYLYFATAFYQGQGDDAAGTTPAAYLLALETLALNLDADIRALTGQTYRVVFMIQQISTWVSRTTPMAALAHVQAMKDLPNLVTVVGPAYQVVHNGEHPLGYSYRMLGEYFAKAQDFMMRTGKMWNPLRPTSVKQFGTRGIVAKFNLPNGYPLTLDTVNVTDPNGQRGFEALDDSGAVALTTVEQIGDDTIHCVASRDITTNLYLNYAFTVPLNAAGGPTTGPRGCLRNTDPAMSYYPDGSGNLTHLYDWCITFSEKAQ